MLSDVVRAVVMAVFHRRRDQLRLVGSAQLTGGRQLIGLEDTLGTRSYVLDLDAEAIYVLAEFCHPLPATAGHCPHYAIRHDADTAHVA